MKSKVMLLVMGLLLVLFSYSFAQVPQMINYQGKITTTAGLLIDTTVAMTFSIYADPLAMPPSLWGETQDSVEVEKGVFSVLLGSVNPIPDSVFDGGIRYLAVKVGDDPVMTPLKPIVSVAYAYRALNVDNDWTFRITDTADTTLITGGAWGIARYGNTLYGNADFTHINLGVASTTGTSGQNYKYCTVGGGASNTASGELDGYATVGGGAGNTASGELATIGGGSVNTASGTVATVGGGAANTASGIWAAVGGGSGNTASGQGATVGGGQENTASDYFATVGGGYSNTSAGSYSFTTGNSSAVPVSYDNSAAFNGQTATASGQTRVGVLSKASGSFTIDHPLDPDNKMLNHYFVESPEMVNIYRGVAYLDANGRAEAHLPDYFDALNRNPMVQLTGVGTSDVFVADEVSGNRFVIGGRAGTKVFWMVTGDRKDQSAEITRIIMPVEQVKTDALAGRSLDDAFLLSTMQQLERMGEAGKLSFRTTAGRQRYEDMKRKLEEKKREK